MGRGKGNAATRAVRKMGNIQATPRGCSMGFYQQWTKENPRTRLVNLVKAKHRALLLKQREEQQA